MLKILHFADAHIDMANYGKHDPVTNLPARVVDFLKSLDTIVDTAIAEKVDLVLFAGDAYKDRSPQPTFQREWGRRIMRLSRAGIPTLLLVGNHDLSPALNRAHALDPFATLEVPHVRVLDKPQFLGPDDLEGLPLQVIALPWVSRAGLVANLGLEDVDVTQVYEQLGERLEELVARWVAAADPNLPIVLTAHCSVQGATYGGERAVMLGADLVLPGSLVRNPALAYVALGHIHKPQNLNANAKAPGGTDQPPVIYPGSIERVDFGECRDDKFFVIANVQPRHTDVEWRKLDGVRPFMDRHVTLTESEGITERLLSVLPPADTLDGVILRLVLEYPREWEAMIDEAALRQHTCACFEFHLVKRPQVESRIRIPGDGGVGSLTPLELLDVYWRAAHVEQSESDPLNGLAADIIHEVEGEA